MSNRFVRAEGLIARAEVKADLEKLDDALADFQQAKEEAPNSVTYASSILHIVEIYLRKGETTEAMATMQEFNNLNGLIEQGIILEKKKELDIKLLSLREPFIIELDAVERSLKYVDYEMKLLRSKLRGIERIRKGKGGAASCSELPDPPQIKRKPLLLNLV